MTFLKTCVSCWTVASFVLWQCVVNGRETLVGVERYINFSDLNIRTSVTNNIIKFI